MKKLIFSLPVIILFFSVMFINGCNESPVVNNQEGSPGITGDMPAEYFDYTIMRYVKVTPAVGSVYYEWQTFQQFSLTSFSPSNNYQYFTTPAAVVNFRDRSEETQYYKVVRTLDWTCRPITEAWWSLNQDVSPGTLYFHGVYNLYYGNYCGSGQTYGNYYMESSNFNIPASTPLRANYGFGSLEDDDDDNNE